MSPSAREDGPSTVPLSVARLLDREGRLSLWKVGRLSRSLLSACHISHEFQKAKAQQRNLLPDLPLALFRELAGDPSHQFDPERLFPMPLPPRPRQLAAGAGGHISSRRRRSRWEVWHTAWGLAEDVITFCNQWDSESGIRPPLARACSVPTPFQETAFRRLVTRLAGAIRPHQALELGRGRGSIVLHRLLDSFNARWNVVQEHGTFQTDPSILVAATDVDVEKLRLPTEAGLLDTVSFLPQSAGRVFVSAEARVLSDTIPIEPEPAPCFMVPRHREPALRDRLLSTRMARLIPEKEVARRRDGRLLLNGCFAVFHPKGQRCIFDCRPANAGELRLPWCRLPIGPMLCWLQVSRREIIRGSGDDLSNWFYQLNEAPSMHSRRAFGRRIEGPEAVRLGGRPDQAYRLALQVLGMGSSNAPDIAQLAHETLLQRAGCLREGTILRYRDPLPDSKLFEGVYLDDHVVVAVVPRKNALSVEGPDRELVKDSHRAYAAAGIGRSEGKAYGFADTSGDGPPKPALKFEAWGTAVDGLSGRVGAPVVKRLEIMALIMVALSHPLTSRTIVTRLLGLLVHPYMHCRPMSAALQSSYEWNSSLETDRLVRWPPAIKQELLGASLLLLVADSFTMDHVSPILSCTDATPQGGGSVRVVAAPQVGKMFFDCGEKRGEHVRLDWKPWDLEARATEMARAPQFVRDFLQDAPWTVDRSGLFPESAHVNIQEAREVAAEYLYRSEASLVPERFSNVVDSRVALGALAKGRSSSRFLNRVLRSNIGAVAIGRKLGVNLWCASADNPADDPSRMTELRPPRDDPVVPRKLTHPVLPSACTTAAFLVAKGHLSCRDSAISALIDSSSDKEGWKFLEGLWEDLERLERPEWAREVFSGRGGLTRALLANGIPCRSPVEAFPGPRKYRRVHDITQDDVFVGLLCEAISGYYGFIHFGVPCSTWSALARMNGSSRCLACPDGARPLTARDAESMLQADRTAVLCLVLEAGGSLYSIENPIGSMLFHSTPFRILWACSHATEVAFDQCCHGLRPPPFAPLPGSRAVPQQDDQFVRKSTIVWGNFPELRRLASRCPGPRPGHRHAHALGSRRTLIDGRARTTSLAMSAGIYPAQLCSAWASAVGAALRHKHILQPRLLDCPPARAR